MREKKFQRLKTDMCRFGDVSAIPIFTMDVFVALNLKPPDSKSQGPGRK
jgi:hypothetical protein